MKDKQTLEMNRKKKINETLKGKAKKANAKLHSSNKPKYIAKAERAGIAEVGKEGSPIQDITSS